MEPVPNPLLLSYMDISSVPNPLFNANKDDAPVPDPLSAVTHFKDVGRDLSPSSTMVQLNDGLLIGEQSASYNPNDVESISFFLSEVQPTQVLDKHPILVANSEVSGPNATDGTGHDLVSTPATWLTSHSGIESATISATPPPLPSDMTKEGFSCAMIVDDDSSKEGRRSPGDNDSLRGEAGTLPVVAGGSTGKRSAAASVGAKPKKRKYRTGGDSRMTEQRKVERRERNREHAKKSRIRKKNFTESMQEAANLLRAENAKLRSAIHKQLGDGKAQEVLMARFAAPNVDGLHSAHMWEGGRCSESLLASARELAVKVAMNNLKERSGVDVATSTNS